MNRRSGLTLIELMIAMAIGLVILSTIFYGFRVATAAMSTANRLSLENGLLRHGFLAALEEADFWTSYDAPDGDPYDATFNGQGLRTSFDNSVRRFQGSEFQRLANSGTRLGLPFTPFHDVADTSDFVTSPVKVFDPDPDYHAALRAERASSAVAARDSDRGWYPGHWSAVDPRTWYRGPWAQRWDTDARFGRYGMISHVKTRPLLGNANGHWTYDRVGGGAGVSTGDFGQVEALHTWRENQMLGVRHALGYYGLLDYLPANAVLATSGTIVPVPGGGGFVDIDEKTYWGWLAPSTGNSPVRDNTSSPKEWFPSSRIRPARSVLGSAVGILPRSPYAGLWQSGYVANDQLTDDAIVGIPGHRIWRTAGHDGGWNGSDKQHYVSLMARVHLFKPFMLEKPAHWPDTYLGLKRYFVRGRFAAIASVRWVSRGSGDMAEIAFPVFGTTLRGARQQRHRDGGWADWHAAGDPANDPTLDDP